MKNIFISTFITLAPTIALAKERYLTSPDGLASSIAYLIGELIIPIGIIYLIGKIVFSLFKRKN